MGLAGLHSAHYCIIMNIFTAIILGAIQGLTEFLPVSSSGHLVLFQKLFGVNEPALFFDTMVHVGTLAALAIVLWRDIWAILKHIIQPLTAYLILATLPAVIAALLFKDTVEEAFSSGNFLGFAFLITAALLFGAEMLSKKVTDTKNLLTQGRVTQKTMNWPDALVIGLLQAVAIIPGVSRSGATLSGSLFRKLDRDFAARFSFLLSIPAILGALVLQLKDLAGGPAIAAGSVDAAAGSANSASSAITAASGATISGIGAAPIIAGTLSAALVGFFSIRLMLKIVREKSLIGFAVYTAALGVLVLIDQLFVHLVF
jgi:undecaprenyl-diphosphatase